MFTTFLVNKWDFLGLPNVKGNYNPFYSIWTLFGVLNTAYFVLTLAPCEVEWKRSRRGAAVIGAFALLPCSLYVYFFSCPQLFMSLVWNLCVQRFINLYSAGLLVIFWETTHSHKDAHRCTHWLLLSLTYTIKWFLVCVFLLLVYCVQYYMIMQTQV